MVKGKRGPSIERPAHTRLTIARRRKTPREVCFAHRLNVSKLKSFLQFHCTGEEPLRDDEITILNGVLYHSTISPYSSLHL